VNAGERTWLGRLLLLLLVGTLCLLALFALASRDVHAPRGEELRCENVGFRVLGVAAADRVGAPGSERSARGLYRIVRLEVANHSKDGAYDLAWHHALVIDARGRVLQLDRDATDALRSAENVPVPARIAHGERCVTPLVYDVPSDAYGLTLRIAWELAALPNFVDLVAHGDRRLLLEETR
jgi:hypothetical protein